MRKMEKLTRLSFDGLVADTCQKDALRRYAEVKQTRKV